MIGLAVEIAVNFIQQVVFIGFLYLFFDKPENKLKNILGFSISVLGLFAMATYFTFNEMTFNHLDSIITLVVMVLYAVIFLKGALHLRIIIPVAAFALNLLVAYLNALLLTSFGNHSFMDAVTFSTSFRYLYLFIGNAVYIGLLVIMLLSGRKKIKLNNIYDIISVIVIPLLIYASLISALVLYKTIDFNESVLWYLIIIVLSLAAIAVLFWILLFRISKTNEIRTELLLGKQREELYKDSVLSANEKIETISSMKHDTYNQFMTLDALLKSKEYEKAQELCAEASSKIGQTQTPFHTENPVLNAILNVETEKAAGYGSVLTAEVYDTLTFVEDSDVVSIIGNLIDNAIEYLSRNEDLSKTITLKIDTHNNFCYVTCINPIADSVMESNPQLLTTKQDNLLHGKGINILRKTAEKYDGELALQEVNNEIKVSVILEKSV